jgi:tyrosinase
LDTAKLGYTYDRFETVPACAATGPAIVAAPEAKRHAAVATAVALGAEPVRVNLEPPSDAKEAAPSLTAAVQKLSGSRRLYLVVKKLMTETQPGVLYNVYLDLPSGAKPDNAHYVGSVNFFHAGAHGDHGAAPPQTEDEKFLSFDVTQVAKNLARKKQLSDKPNLTIVPRGKPDAEAKPVIGEISLVEQ